MPDDDLIVENPVPATEPTGDFQYIQEDIPAKDDATLALEARIQELEAERAELVQRQAQPTKSSDDGFKALAEQLARMQTPAPPMEGKPQIDPKNLVEDVNKNFFDNPAMSVVKLLDPILKNVQEQNADVNSKRDLQISKLSVLADPTVSGVYTQYKDEVEAIVASKKASETVYREALQEVQYRHLDDIVAARVASQMEEATKAAEAQVQAHTTKTVPYTNAGQPAIRPPAETSPDEKVRSQADLEKVKQYMLVKGFYFNDVDDRNFVIQKLRAEGVIK